MQLRLTFDELKFLYEILGENDRRLWERLRQTKDQELNREFELKQAPLQFLPDRVVARNLEFTADELDDLVAVLVNCDRELSNTISREKDLCTGRNWQGRKMLLRRFAR